MFRLLYFVCNIADYPHQKYKAFVKFTKTSNKKMEWYSDASFSSSDESDEEDEDVPEIYCERELHYWTLEELMERWPAPAVLDFLNKLCMFDIREAVIAPLGDARDVLDTISANNWDAYWNNGRENKNANLVFEDIDIIGEYSMYLCNAVFEDVSNERIQACGLALLSYGKWN